MIEDFFDVPNLPLNLAFRFFERASIPQIGIVQGLAGFFFDGARRGFDGTFDFVLGAGFHNF